MNAPMYVLNPEMVAGLDEVAEQQRKLESARAWAVELGGRCDRAVYLIENDTTGDTEFGQLLVSILKYGDQ